MKCHINYFSCCLTSTIKRCHNLNYVLMKFIQVISLIIVPPDLCTLSIGETMWKQKIRYSKESWFQSAAVYFKRCLLSLVLLETAEIKWCMQTNNILGVWGLYCAYPTSRTNFCLTASPELVWLEHSVFFVTLMVILLLNIACL